MDLRLYRSVISDNQNFFRELDPSNCSNVLLQVTSQRQDTILHIAAKFKRKDVSEIIMKLLPSLVYKTNSKGDTPLHIAARVGSLDMVDLLINYKNDESVEVEANERLMKMVNNAKNTALHEAVRKGHFEVVELLIQNDEELVKFRNEAGESPLFIAVDNMHLKIADHILKAAPICSFNGRNGMNALHAAVMRMFIEDEVLDLHTTRLQNPLFDIFHFSIKDLRRFFGFCIRTWKKDTDQGIQKCINIKDFIKRLMEKCPSAISEADNFGWTPLHLATHWNDLGLVKDLLSADNSVAYIKNKEGMTALHIAAREGRVHLLREIEETCPDIWDFEDNCGRTALHIAVERGNIEAVKVKFILEKVSEDHINQQDNEGNTALHLAALQGNGKIFESLTNDGRADKTTLNNEGIAVMDKVHSNMELTSYEKVWMIVILSFAGGLASLDRVLNRKHSEANPQETRKEELEKGEALHEAERHAVKRAESYYNLLRNVGNTNMMVETLIATVSFAAAFTVPGGFNSEGPEAGMPILLRRKTSFRAFIVANTVAFCCSTASISLHNFNSMLTDTRALQSRTYIAISLTNWAVCAMHTAFVTGSYAVLTESVALAVVVLIIGCFFLAVQLHIFFQSV